MPRTSAGTRTLAARRVMVRDIKSALRFNATTDKVDLPLTFALPTDQFSYSVWLNPRAPLGAKEGLLGQNGGFMVGRQDINDVQCYAYLNASGDFTGLRRLRVGRNLILPGKTTTVGGTSGFKSGWEHHVYNVYVNGTNNGELQQFINGVLVKTSNTDYTGDTATPTGNVMSLGLPNGNPSGAVTFNGSQSLVRFMNRKLTQAEVTALYTSDTIPNGTLLYKYDLTEGAGTIAYDTSGNANNGTITGATFTSDTPSKARKEVNPNLVTNGDFSYVPQVNVATTTTNRYVDGTAGGSTTNRLFEVHHSHAGTGSTMFDTTNTYNGKPSLKLSTLATASYVEDRMSNTGTYNTTLGNGFELLPSTSYTYRVVMKSNYVSGDSSDGAYLNLLEASGDGTNLGGGFASTKLKTTTGWTVYTGSFTTGATTRRGHLQPRIYGHTGTGTLIMDAWFADIQLRPTTPITRATA